MLIVDVDVVRARADGERFFLHIFAVLVAQLIVQLHVLRGRENGGELAKVKSKRKAITISLVQGVQRSAS